MEKIKKTYLISVTLFLLSEIWEISKYNKNKLMLAEMRAYLLSCIGISEPQKRIM
jgi:hypothetical protein